MQSIYKQSMGRVYLNGVNKRCVNWPLVCFLSYLSSFVSFHPAIFRFLICIFLSFFFRLAVLFFFSVGLYLSLKKQCLFSFAILLFLIIPVSNVESMFVSSLMALKPRKANFFVPQSSYHQVRVFEKSSFRHHKQ